MPYQKDRGNGSSSPAANDLIPWIPHDIIRTSFTDETRSGCVPVTEAVAGGTEGDEVG